MDDFWGYKTKKPSQTGPLTTTIDELPQCGSPPHRIINKQTLKTNVGVHLWPLPAGVAICSCSCTANSNDPM